MKKNMYKKNYYDEPVSAPCYSLGCISMTTACATSVPCKKEEENSMTEKTEAAVQREYLNGRLRDAGWAKDNELWQMFKMDEQTLPRTYKELIDKIKNDKFKLNEKRTKFIDAATADGSLFDIYGCFDGIIWDGGPDIDGYNAATAEMQKARQNAKDVIMGGVYADSMKAIKEFEAWVPTNKPN